MLEADGLIVRVKGLPVDVPGATQPVLVGTACREGRTETFAAPTGEIPLHVRGGSALAMQQAALTTAEVKRSPLTVVVALPRVVGPGAAASDGAAAEQLHAAGEVYMDDGESVDVGSSLCHFLTINSTVSYQQETDNYSGEAVVLFGNRGLHFETAAGSGAAGCQGVNDAALAAGAGDLGFEWPQLAGVQVLGWRRTVGPVHMEVVQRADTCGGLMVVHREAVPASRVAMDGSLRIDLNSFKLSCPFGVRLSWSSAALPQ